MTSERFDAIVIGTGQAGKPLALDLAGAGRRTAVIEREHVGGTCVNVGCTPTKTMVASARVAYLARRGADYGVQTGAVAVDLRRVRQRKQKIVDDFRNGGQHKLEKAANIELIFGEARFSGPKVIEVAVKAGGRRTLTAETIFINTGCRPVRPAISGLDQIPALDSTSIMELEALPEHLLVLGGGYIGLEFGQMFRRFGSAVTIVQHGKQLLSREDPDVAEEVKKVLEEDGIRILLETEAVGVRPTGRGVEMQVRGTGGERTFTGSHLLVAVGRVPNSDRLNLGAAGIKTDARGYVMANEKRIIRDNLLRGGQATTTGRLVPYTVYTDPQLGRCGLTEQEARAQGRKLHVAKIPMSWVARALEMDEPRGFIKAIVDAQTKQIVGCAVLGVEGGEIMSMLEIAMMGKLPYTALEDGIFAHPALSEGLNTLFMYMKKE